MSLLYDKKIVVWHFFIKIFKISPKTAKSSKKVDTKTSQKDGYEGKRVLLKSKLVRSVVK